MTAKKNPASKKQPAIKKLRVWWRPQIPCAAFHVEVATPDEAKKLLRTLANYDLFQLEHRIKPDYCNAGGLEELDGSEWMEWNDDDGNDINEVMRFQHFQDLVQ